MNDEATIPCSLGLGFEVVVRKGHADVEFWYPGREKPLFLEVGLTHVRAADNIRISYDLDRDGWKIEQASTFEWGADDTVRDPEWQEVAFVQAWARQKEAP